MLTFESDYINGCHPAILEALTRTNDESVSGYGNDRFCAEAEAKIKKACGREDAQVEFVCGGTQTNQLVIASMLGMHEGVVSARTGHINAHEAGAIEYTGHKVMELPQYQGKIKASDLKEFLDVFEKDQNNIHMVTPGMVYISHPTEYGTLYSKKELTDLHEICNSFNIPLFMDGARLGYGLAGDNTDVTLQDIARLTDVFYIGGTKVGALCGEAVVFTHNNKPEHFFKYKKQHGALLAKGRLLGVQFDTLFTDNLYYEISKHAMDMAHKLVEILDKYGIETFIETPTNQKFVILDNDVMSELKKKVGFGFWETVDENRTAVRFATSWSTSQRDLDQLDDILKTLKK